MRDQSMMYTAQTLHVTHHTSECGLLYSYRKTIRNGWITTLPSQFSRILYRAPMLDHVISIADFRKQHALLLFPKLFSKVMRGLQV